jgi:hypothetical protein
MTQTACCAVCDAIDECGAFVFALDVPTVAGKTNCYLLTSAEGVAKSPNRAAGVKGQWPPKPVTPAPTPSGGNGPDLIQYYFGSSDMVVAPVLSPIDYSKTSLAEKLVWLPPTTSAGDTSESVPIGWVERWTQRVHRLNGTQQTQGAKLLKLYPLRVVPVFVKSGAVITTIPLEPGNLIGTAQRQYSSLIFSIYPGETAGAGRVYEDDGKTIGYLVDQYAWTTCAYTHDRATGVINVNISTNGTYASLPQTRDYTIQLLNVLPAASASVASSASGHASSVSILHRDALGATTSARPSWHFDGEQVMTVISLRGVSPVGTTIVTVKLPKWPAADRELLNGMRGAIGVAKLAKLALDEVRQNPGGQCCVTNITAPLSQVATWGTALTALAVQPDLTAFQTKLRGFWGMYAGAQVELASLHNKSEAAEFSTDNSTVAPSDPYTTPVVSQRAQAVGGGGGVGDPEPIKRVRLAYGRHLLASAHTTV